MNSCDQRETSGGRQRAFCAARQSASLALLFLAGAGCTQGVPNNTPDAAIETGPPAGDDDIDPSATPLPNPPNNVGGPGQEECGQLLCSNQQWWNSTVTYHYITQFGWYDTDLRAISGTPVVLRHPARLDKEGVYKWGWMPTFTDVMTGEQFQFLHLRPSDRYTTSLGKIYDTGTVVGLSGGDTADTGHFPPGGPKTYSDAAHLCVETKSPFATVFPPVMDKCIDKCPMLQTCMNGKCDPGEDCLNCAADCPCSNGTSCQAGKCMMISPCAGAATGDYCGNNPALVGYQGAASDLVHCEQQLVAKVTPCPAPGVCQIKPAGQNDVCVTPCGDMGQPCCGGNMCNNGVACMKGTCGGCLDNGMACNGKNCGMVANNCGAQVACGGNCTNPQTCGGGGTPNVCGNGMCQDNGMACNGKNCGMVANNCGAMVSCGGNCTNPQTCGGGGTPNVCGNGICQDNGMACNGKNCGTVPNNCGVMVSCGNCNAPQTCAGAGTPNVCGCQDNGMACNGKNCGKVTNNCGVQVSCGGNCTNPQTCGGGGTPNVCGNGICQDNGMACNGKSCGTVANNCGAQVSCGSCNAPQSCGGGGTPNVCGCQDNGMACNGKSCGMLTNNCGVQVSCGSCNAPQTCGGGGTPNVCGCQDNGAACNGKNCGTVINNCNVQVSCGSCIAPQTCGGGGTANVCVGGTCPNNTNGLYCGGDGIPGDTKTLYQCTAGVDTFVKICIGGCHVAPQGKNDYCNAGACPNSTGAYCGGDGVPGATNTLYQCANGVLTNPVVCNNGCHVAGPGKNDYCN